MKKILIVSTILIVLLVAGGAGFLYYYVNSDSFRAQVRSVILENIEKHTGRKASLAEVKGTLFGSFHIGKLAIKESDGTTDFISVDSIYLQPELMALLKKQIRISSIIVSKPGIRIVKTGDKFNFSDIMELQKKGAVENKATTSSISLDIHTLKIEKALLDLTLDGNTLKIHDIDVDLIPGDLKVIAGTVRNLKLEDSRINIPMALKDVSFKLTDFDDFEIIHGKVVSDLIEVMFSGNYSDIGTDPKLDFSIEIPVLDLPKLLPSAKKLTKLDVLDNLSFEGSNTIQHVKGSLKGKISVPVKDWDFIVSGKVDLASGKYALASFKGIDWNVSLKEKILEVTQNTSSTTTVKWAAFPEVGMKNLVLKGNADKFSIDSLEVMGMKISGNLSQRSLFDLSVKGDKKIPELLEFFPEPGILSLSPSGNISMDISVKGDVNKPLETTINGSALLDLAVKPPFLGDMNMKADLVFEKQDITLKGFTWNLSDLASGSIKGKMSGLNNPAFDLSLDAKLTKMEPLFAAAGLKTIKLIGDAELSATLKGSAKNPAVSGELKLGPGTFWYKGEDEAGKEPAQPFELPYDSLNSKITYDGKKVILNPAALKLLGGEISADAQIDTAVEGKPLRVSVKSTQDLKVEQLLAKSKLLQDVINGSGIIDFSMTSVLKDLIPSLSGKGFVRIVKGKINLPVDKIPQLQGIEGLETLVYDEIYTDVNMNEGVIHLGPAGDYKSSKLFAKAALFSSAGQGTLDLKDFMIDYAGNVKIHPDLLKNSQYDLTVQLQKFGGNKDMMDSAMKTIEKEGGIPLSFTIKGIVPDNHKIEPDMKAMEDFTAKITTNIIADFAKQKLLGKGGDLLKGKGGDLLNNMLGGNKTPDAQTPATAPSDTEPPKTDIKTQAEDKLKSLNPLKKFGF